MHNEEVIALMLRQSSRNNLFVKTLTAEIETPLVYVESLDALDRIQQNIALVIIENDKNNDHVLINDIQHLKTLNLPIILLLQEASSALSEDATALDIADYILMDAPYSIVQLCHSVTRLLANRKHEILIVDDSRSARLVLEKLAHNQLLTVHSVDNGAEALAALEKYPNISLVITDYEMDQIDGVELIHNIKAKPKFKNVGIIGISAIAGQRAALRLLKAGANDVLLKPVVPEDFYARVNRCLNDVEAMAQAVELKAAKKRENEITSNLKKLQAHYQTTLDTVADGVVTVGSDGVITDVNFAMVELFGYSRDELLGSDINRLMPNHTLVTQAADKLGDTMAYGSSIMSLGREIVGHKKDGSKIPMYLSVGESTVGGETFYYGIAHDITRQKQIEKALKSALEKQQQLRREAEKTNMAKSEFISSMSHELRTSLNAIIGFAQVLKSDHRTPLSEFQNSSVDHILGSGQQLLELINQILEMAKIESGNISLNNEPFDINDVIEECLQAIESLASERYISVAKGNLTAGIMVRGDRVKTRQIVMNLLSNAIKYNKDNGRIALRYSLTANGLVELEVEDTGIGIAADKMTDLFTPFQRLGAESLNIAGTGVGLSISFNLARLMGGDLVCNSIKSKGSTFIFSMPAVMQEQGSEKHKRQTSSSNIDKHSHFSVLYVEDSRANRALLEAAFETHEHLNLICSHDGQSGIVAATDTLPDMLIIDINLPDMNGVEVLRQIRALQLDKPLPAIALSAVVTKRDIDASLAAGFQEYLAKPINLDELFERIAFYLA